MLNGKIAEKVVAIAAIILLTITPALALDLAEAKSSGVVGETSSGYLAAVAASDEVDALVQRINGQRKAHYKKIASENGISLESVEARAGQKAIEKSSPGAYIDAGDGWRKK